MKELYQPVYIYNMFTEHGFRRQPGPNELFKTGGSSFRPENYMYQWEWVFFHGKGNNKTPLYEMTVDV